MMSQSQTILKGLDILGKCPGLAGEQFKDFMRKQIEKWRKVVKAAGIEGG